MTELAVEPLRAEGEPDGRYVSALLARLDELDLTRRTAALHSRLQRLDPSTEPEAYNQVFGELVALEQPLRAARERGAGIL